ncbi:glycoside hydrolase family 3 N-terminal domain-containing protein [Spirulina sp. CCNP1310]|uniref:glycoside hydrolase family 3 N-terminal domain-containing protein n=1 Tax=Spirulina sp. CCNP1310 TaxID=3110249 RepID=UPI002B2175B8|nr:glycoside hydrolase family 3 N-terminal domain-containing protein [Spirulina sp. CCNP1310]MEA5417904.1 glycoside hydrolase family 3 N-terminal domain-containing protein [Spirulina sp. CCNP1310]
MTSPSLRSQIGQMIVVRASGHLLDHQIRYPQWEAPQAKLHRWISEWNVGGVILLGGTVAELALRTAQLQSWATTPLLIAADIEEGVGQRFPGATELPPPMALQAIANQSEGEEYARQMGEITAQESLALGLNWILAPVVDVNNNPENPVINVRAFGEDAATVSRLAAAFIEGCHRHPVLTCAKHFPGHGDTSVDSHLALPEIPHGGDRLSTVEIPPFAAAIAAGVDGVMSGHLMIPAWDDAAPATLSQPILTGQLRQNLGFEGLIVTDALVMGGIAHWASPEEVAVQAVAAGADIVLMPADPEQAILAIEAAVTAGRIPPEQITASVARIAAAKAKVIPPPREPVGDRLTHLHTPSSQKILRQILTASLRQGGTFTPKPEASGSPLNMIIVGNLLNMPFLDLATPAIALPQSLGYQHRIIEPPQLLEIAAPPVHPHNLLQIFIRGNPFRGTAGLAPEIKAQLKCLLQNQYFGALALYGSPYLADWFSANCDGTLPWVFSYGQMPAAQDIVLNILLKQQISHSLHFQKFGEEFI